MVQINLWRIQSAWEKKKLGQDTQELLGNLFQEGESVPLCFFKIYFLLGQFSGSSFQIIPATFWPISQCFTLDEGICLCGKGLCCPGRGEEGVVGVGVLLPICQCTHSVISANRPEEPSPAGPREEAEDFRATDSGVMMKFDHVSTFCVEQVLNFYLVRMIVFWIQIRKLSKIKDDKLYKYFTYIMQK